MLDLIKLAMRLKTPVFDDEIEMYIASCRRNLILAGIEESKIDEFDNVLINTFTAYVKWQMDFQGKGDRWEAIYKNLRCSLALDVNYRHVD